MKVSESIADLIGHTPLLRLYAIEKAFSVDSKIIAKLEYFNPMGSVKDRAAYRIISDAEKNDIIKKNSVIIEPTSGNMGIGLAFVAVTRGYRVILTMPETMSVERRNMLLALGAEIRLTPGSEGMQGAINLANELLKEIPNSYMPQQFSNPSNIDAHIDSTAKEIWDDTDGSVDIFVAGVGTGGTISGVSMGLKSKKPSIKAIAVEPAESAVLSGQKKGAHKIQGIGAGFVPDNFKRQYVDEIAKVTSDEAFYHMRMIAKAEAVLVGVSSGAALCAALSVARQEENKGKTIVVLFPDTGERYLSMRIFD